MVFLESKYLFNSFNYRLLQNYQSDQCHYDLIRSEIYMKTIKWSIVLWIYKNNNNNNNNNNNDNSIIQLQDDVLPATSLVGDLLWLQQVI